MDAAVDLVRTARLALEASELLDDNAIDAICSTLEMALREFAPARAALNEAHAGGGANG